MLYIIIAVCMVLVAVVFYMMINNYIKVNKSKWSNKKKHFLNSIKMFGTVVTAVIATISGITGIASNLNDLISNDSITTTASTYIEETTTTETTTTSTSQATTSTTPATTEHLTTEQSEIQPQGNFNGVYINGGVNISVGEGAHDVDAILYIGETAPTSSESESETVVSETTSSVETTATSESP
jgi:hypothetical protein